MKIKAAATAKLRSPKPFAMHTVPSLAQKHPVSYSSHWPLVVIGASTGGPRALTAIFQALPEDLYASVIVIQHMPEGFTEAFSDRLNKIGPLSVAEGSEGAQLKVGCVYVAPGGQHMKLTERGVLHLSKEAPVHGVRPAVDVMMLSIAKYWRSNVIAVVLTGMGVDGAAGVMALSQRGAHVIAEDESSCVVFGMPKAAIGTGCVKRVVPLEMIPTAIAEGVKAQCKVLTAS
jgi:two-component system chemotaxis response regulator CheB